MDIYLTREQTMSLEYHGVVKVDDYFIIKHNNYYYVTKILDNCKCNIHFDQTEFKIVVEK